MPSVRPTWPERMRLLAAHWAQYSTCIKRQVGAVIFTPTFQILSIGYNDTPQGWINCGDGGCLACAESLEQGTEARHNTDCNCVHAEKNALNFAARNGVRTDGAFIITDGATPYCNGCLKDLAQAGVTPWSK